MRLIRRIKHVLYWLPIIWADHDWDWGYLLTMLIHKLESMRELFQSDDAMCEDAETVAEQIEAALVFLRNVNDNIYEDSVIDEHERVYGESEIVFDDVTISLVYPHDDTGHTEEQRAKHHVDLYKKACEQKQNAIEHAFSIIGENLMNWWD